YILVVRHAEEGFKAPSEVPRHIWVICEGHVQGHRIAVQPLGRSDRSVYRALDRRCVCVPGDGTAESRRYYQVSRECAGRQTQQKTQELATRRRLRDRLFSASAVRCALSALYVSGNLLCSPSFATPPPM